MRETDVLKKTNVLKEVDDVKVVKRQPIVDDRGVIDPRQRCCATCKHRSTCGRVFDGVREVAPELEAPNASLVALMYLVCDDYETMYIDYPIVVQKIVTDSAHSLASDHAGRFAVVEVNADGYDAEQHLAIYCGELPLSIVSAFAQNGELTNRFMVNPALFVISFKRMFYGINCRWKFIETTEDLLTIVDDDCPDCYFEAARLSINADEDYEFAKPEVSE